MLNKPSVRKDIRDLNDSYIIAPADKDANHFVVVCKKFYVEVLKDARTGTMRQAHLFIHATQAMKQYTNSMQWGNGGRGQEDQRPTAVLYYYYLQSLKQVYFRTRRHRHTHKSPKENKERKEKCDRVVDP